MDVMHQAIEIRGLKKDVDAVSKLLDEMARLDKDRSSNLPQLRARLDKLDEHLRSLETGPRVNRATRAWAEQYRRKLVDAEDALKKRFGAELDRHLRTQGLTLSGQYPDLKAGMFTIDPDFAAHKCTFWYGPKQERLDQCRLSVEEVASRLDKAKQQLGSSLDGDQFLAKLQRAYSRVVGGHAVEPAPIVEVMAELAFLLQGQRFHQDPRREHYTSYSRADFSYDLFRYRESGLLDKGRERVHLAVATRAHTRQRRDFLWVPDDASGRGTTYSHLQIREAQP